MKWIPECQSCDDRALPTAAAAAAAADAAPAAGCAAWCKFIPANKMKWIPECQSCDGSTTRQRQERPGPVHAAEEEEKKKPCMKW
jgi:hypothetical protein